MSELKDKVILEIKKIYDPEIPVNIYELGLIYKIDIKDAKKVNIEMTLTSPNCPVAESLPKMVKDNILKLNDVDDAGHWLHHDQFDAFIAHTQEFLNQHAR